MSAAIPRTVQPAAMRLPARARVYIASPYTIGDPEENVRASYRAYHRLRDAGLFPFAPLHGHHINELQARHYEDWMTIDIEWLEVCHAVLRLPGESSGADREVAHAQAKGIPVYFSIEELLTVVIEEPQRKPLPPYEGRDRP